MKRGADRSVIQKFLRLFRPDGRRTHSEENPHAQKNSYARICARRRCRLRLFRHLRSVAPRARRARWLNAGFRPARRVARTDVWRAAQGEEPGVSKLFAQSQIFLDGRLRAREGRISLIVNQSLRSDTASKVVRRDKKTMSAIVNLAGKVTESGWTIGKLIQKKDYQTGGCFSVSYMASNQNGREAFLKAFDFGDVDNSDDPARAIQELVNAYNFERDLLEKCRGANLDKIVIALDDGTVFENTAPLKKVFYLIFELAESDIRFHAVERGRQDICWSLRAMHQISVGLRQLHRNRICHQDIKPSNILVFENGTQSKIADLGRAHCSGMVAPHDTAPIPGAFTHAPPEQLYQDYNSGDFSARKCADLYNLGGMMSFLLTGVSFTSALMMKLRDEHRPSFRIGDSASEISWNGSFRNALPYVQHAHERVIEDFSCNVADQLNLNKEHKTVLDLKIMLESLTNPDPSLRGHPTNRFVKHGDVYALDKYVSGLNRLAFTCGILAKGR